jgi:hypothetical protein
VYIRGIPQLQVAQRDEARRLVTLMDILYDAGCKGEPQACGTMMLLGNCCTAQHDTNCMTSLCHPTCAWEAHVQGRVLWTAGAEVMWEDACAMADILHTIGMLVGSGHGAFDSSLHSLPHTA